MARIASRSGRCCESPVPPGNGGDGGRGGDAGAPSAGMKGGDVYLVGSAAFISATRDFSIKIHGGMNGTPSGYGIGGEAGIGAPALRAASGCGGHLMPKGTDGVKLGNGSPKDPIETEPEAGELFEIEFNFLS